MRLSNVSALQCFGAAFGRRDLAEMVLLHFPHLHACRKERN
jgi:hypothetical protein